ncbi:MAG: hypothetical protein MRJ65_12005 [Candidatus Brocadiaceae bacterium]|nr:hypothetical protein [Candidatus Brocadiaceae bacterium]
MPEEKGECPCSESLTGAGTPTGGAMEISPVAFELLRHAAIPFEFKNAVGKVAPDISMPLAAEMEETPVSPKMDMTSVEMPTLRMSVPPIGMLVASVP